MDNPQSSQSAPSTVPESHQEEDHFQRRINDIRMQLDDTYNIFVNARETLSSISFESLGERLNSHHLQAGCSNESVENGPQQEITLVRDAHNQVDVMKSLEQLNALAPQDSKVTISEDIPELNKFFQVISDLTEGIKKINGHQQSIMELNENMNSMTVPLSSDPSGSQTALPERLANMTID